MYNAQAGQTLTWTNITLLLQNEVKKNGPSYQLKKNKDNNNGKKHLISRPIGKYGSCNIFPSWLGKLFVYFGYKIGLNLFLIFFYINNLVW